VSLCFWNYFYIGMIDTVSLCFWNYFYIGMIDIDYITVVD